MSAAEGGERCPVDVAARIAGRIAEEIERRDGVLASLDVRKLTAQFPGFEEEVLAQLRELTTATVAPSPPFGVPRLDAVPRRLGPYVLGHVLGGGGTGIVHEARDTRLDRDVALKILRNPWHLEREARVLAALSAHPHILQVYGIEEQEGFAFIAMELVRGTSLDRVILEAQRRAIHASGERGVGLQQLLDAAIAHSPRETFLDTYDRETSTPVDPEAILGGAYFRDVCTLLSDAAAALHHAHREGYVHRDVKPANLLVDRNLHLKVADFSHAKGERLSRLSRTGRFLGTVPYASPEQIAGRRSVGPATDVWSLGVTLHELVTLQLPFPGRDEDETAARVLAGKPLAPRRLNSRIPVDLERVILRCLEFEPSLRYPDADLLAGDLARIAAGEAPHVRPVSGLRRMVHRLRNPGWRLIAGLLAIALLLGAGLALGVTELRRLTTRLQLRAERLRESRAALARGAHQTAIERAVEAFVDDPRDASARRALELATGLAAWHQGDVHRAAAFLQAADRTERLDDEARLVLARALFARNDLTGAREQYEALAGADDLPWRSELRLVDAFGGAMPTDLQDSGYPRFANAGGLPGLEDHPWSVLGVIADRKDRYAGRLRLFPEGIRATFVDWTPEAAGTVGAVCLGDLTGDGVPELVASGDEALFVARGPFAADRMPTWQALEDPLVADGSLLGESWWNKENPRGALRSLRRVAILPPAEERAARIVTARSRAIGTLRVDWSEGVATAREGRRECGGSDVHALRIVELRGEHALLVAWGPWDRFGVELYVARSRGLTLVSSATTGSVTDARWFVGGDGEPLLLLAVCGSETYGSSHLFGAAAPYGWGYGIHAVRPDLASRSVETLAALTWSRPRHPRLILDTMPSPFHAGRSVLLVAENRAAGPDHADIDVHRTLVLELEDSRTLLAPLLRLPGAVLATFPAPEGQVDLLVAHSGDRLDVVRWRP